MPIIKRAIKKLRHDKKRAALQAKKRETLRNTLKDFRKKPTKKGLSAVFTTIDKSAKIHIIHTNKADRLKSRLSKLLIAK